MVVHIKYSPTVQLIAKPLDPIESPWLQPKRRQITALWLPTDAERFARHLQQSHSARLFTRTSALEFSECTIDEVQFIPEMKRELLFTNLPNIDPSGREPHRNGPFLRLSSPYHMGYSPLLHNHHLLHYIEYSRNLLIGGRLETQAPIFLGFAKEACDWLMNNYVSDRGRNTADNLQEWLRAKPYLGRQSVS